MNKENTHPVINILILLPTTVILVLILGCKPDNIKTSVFSSVSCISPCWQNIYPGKTEQDEVIEILNHLEFVDQKSITVRGEPWSIFNDAIYATFRSGKIKAEIYFINKKVSMMIFSGEIDLQISDAIDDFGEPKYVINIPMSGGMPLAPSSSFVIVAVNPEKGIEYSFDTRNLAGNLKKEIRADTLLGLISFFNPNDYEKILNDRLFSMAELSGEETIQYMKPWTGYGSILEKYPPAIIK